jgi:amino acid adenylation domain-containing protein/non-ribosomal peptide synthase protein (TIGR01720 family)
MLSQHNAYPLTEPQKRIWYIENIYSDTSMYNLGVYSAIRSHVNFECLEKAIHLLLMKHEGMRLRMVKVGDEVRQVLVQPELNPIRIIDFRNENNAQEAFELWTREEFRKPFKLINTPLYHFSFFHMDDQHTGFLFKFHHLISDGWCLSALIEEIWKIYDQLMNGSSPSTEPIPSYIEYISTEHKYLTSKKYHKNKAFWLDTFSTIPEAFLYRSSEETQGNRKTFVLESSTSERIKQFIEYQGCSINTFFVTLFSIYLHKITQDTDFILGTPVLNRSGFREKQMFGMFTSTMPFQVTVNPSEQFNDVITSMNKALIQNYFHQKYPYNHLVQDLDLKKQGFDQLFQMCVNYYNTKLIHELNGQPIVTKEIYNGNQLYSLQVVIKDWLPTGELSLDFDYKVADYTESQIDQMFEHIQAVIQTVLRNPECIIQDVNVLDQREREKLIFKYNQTFFDYPKEKTIVHLFEEQATSKPHRTAIEFESRSVTYKELNVKANQIAHQLMDCGVKSNQLVAILATHSIEAVAAMLGVLKVGAAYVPIDVDYPSERIQYIIADSQCKVLLSNVEMIPHQFEGDIIQLDHETALSGQTENLSHHPSASDLAYVIYTSGSTGKPKGTLVEHQGLINYLWWAKLTYIDHADDAFALYSSLAFDLTITSIFTPLINGNRIIIYKDDKEEFILYKILRDNRAAVIKLTPAHLSLLREKVYTDSMVKVFILGGENLKTSLAQEIAGNFPHGLRLFNEYGPTETVVGCMIHLYDPVQDMNSSVSIGLPIHNTHIYVLDSDLQPVPMGVPGEIYIAGDGVARGYLNRDQLTNERFLANPFIPGSKMYKTGDLAVRKENGTLTYLGRTDDQVKIRGYRIELGEIENCMASYAYIHNAVVVDRKDDNGISYLCAYVAGQPGYSEDRLRTDLYHSLPHFMIPSYFISMEQIPLTSNGKVDRQRLPVPNVYNMEKSNIEDELQGDEKVLMNVIRSVLNNNNLSSLDNFYHVGGDSIKAIQLSSKLLENGLRVKVKDILNLPVFKQLASAVEPVEEATQVEISRCEGYIENTPILHWFWEQAFENRDHWNQSMALKVNQAIPIQYYQRVFEYIVDKHDALRMNYDSVRHKLFYNDAHDHAPFPVEQYDLSEMKHEEQLDQIRRLGKQLKSSFHIESRLLFKAGVFQISPNEHRLLMTAHHLVMDAVSWRIILNDLIEGLKRLIEGKDLPPIRKTASYQSWSERIQDVALQDVIHNQHMFWEAQLKGTVTYPFVKSSARSKEITRPCEKRIESLSQAQTQQLMTEAHRAYSTSPNDLLVAALLSAFVKKGGDDIVLELESHGRLDGLGLPDVSSTVGWFTSMYPMRFRVNEEGQRNLPDLIKRTKEQLRSTPHLGIGYGLLRFIDQSINGDLKRVRFNYIGELDNALPEGLCKLSFDDYGEETDARNRLSCLIEVISYIIDGQLHLSFTYDPEELDSNDMDHFLLLYKNQLLQLMDHCCSKQDVSFTPSDFEAANLTQFELDDLFD